MTKSYKGHDLLELLKRNGIQLGVPNERQDFERGTGIYMAELKDGTWLCAEGEAIRNLQATPATSSEIEVSFAPTAEEAVAQLRG